MILEVQKGNAEIIGKAVALLRGKVPEGKIARAETFTRQYYSRVEADDLAERNLSDLCRIVVSIIFACDRGFEPIVARHIQVFGMLRLAIGSSGKTIGHQATLPCC